MNQDGGRVSWAEQRGHGKDFCPFSQQEQAVMQGASSQFPIAPSMENGTQLPLDGPDGGLRVQPGGLPPATAHGLLQEMVVSL